MNFRKYLFSTVALIGLLAIPTVSFGFDGSTWINTYRGGYGHNVYETPDGGGIIGGSFGADGVCCTPWLVKLNPDGSVDWQITYEAPGLGGATNMVPTQDGGYAIAGDGVNFMVIKVDAGGNVQWAKNYGDGGYTHLRVLESNEGNFLVTGATELEDRFYVNGRAMLLDPSGNVLWDKVYGNAGAIDYITSATLAYNGNFITVGSSRGHYWVMELDQEGNVVWQNIYGGLFEDTGLVVTKALKHYYLVVGASDSYAGEGPMRPSPTRRNWWALVLSKSGRPMNQFSLGGFDAEDPHAAISTSDGGFMIGGGTGSFGSGFSDIWLVKFDRQARIEWQKTYGRPGRTDHAWQIEETATGYAVIGDSYYWPTDYDVWLMTLDRNGNVESGDCGFVGDTHVSPWKTNASIVLDAGVLTWDTRVNSFDMKIRATAQTGRIETCSSSEPTD